MTGGEQAYLVMAIAAALVFIATLAWASRHSP
jgi:hypothetical protein